MKIKHSSTITKNQFYIILNGVCQHYLKILTELKTHISKLKNGSPVKIMMEAEAHGFNRLISDLLFLKYSDYYKNSQLKQWANDKTKNR